MSTLPSLILTCPLLKSACQSKIIKNRIANSVGPNKTARQVHLKLQRLQNCLGLVYRVQCFKVPHSRVKSIHIKGIQVMTFKGNLTYARTDVT